MYNHFCCSRRISSVVKQKNQKHGFLVTAPQIERLQKCPRYTQNPISITLFRMVSKYFLRTKLRIIPNLNSEWRTAWSLLVIQPRVCPPVVLVVANQFQRAHPFIIPWDHMNAEISRSLYLFHILCHFSCASTELSLHTSIHLYSTFLLKNIFIT